MRDVVISLFDHSGVMVRPWKEHGYECWLVDIQHGTGTRMSEGLYKAGWDLRRPWEFPMSMGRIAFVSAFPPCDHLAVSGARWFKGKGLRALADSVNMFATAAKFCENSGAPYMIENPVSMMSTYWRKPDYSFHPHQFTRYCGEDNYVKKTCLWTGGEFVMPEECKDNTLPDPDHRIHRCPPGPKRKGFRSMTPAGFAEAVFRANRREMT